MGYLVVRHYPTKLFLKAADHTYVECGTGAIGWACWGGKEGGKYLRSASGSTLRANAIAEPPKDHAGITCYLVNGVCHQAANRILLPAGITVDGARGYSLSVAIFGVYGRPRGLKIFCRAPFNSHSDVVGDLIPCMGDVTYNIDQAVSFNSDRPDYSDEGYLDSVRRLYDRANVSIEKEEPVTSLVEFQMQQFRMLLEHKFRAHSSEIDDSVVKGLMDARLEFEGQRLNAELSLLTKPNGMAYVKRFDELTLKFQDDVARLLPPHSYQRLLNLSHDDRIVLSDPSIVERVYGGKPDFPDLA